MPRVAPRAGAWIETTCLGTALTPGSVSPCFGKGSELKLYLPILFLLQRV